MGGKRRTHCPAGRILYRQGELPATLATATMLSKVRRRLAEGQEPVASLLCGPRAYYAPLYVIAAAVELPALKGKVLARWQAARACARCSAASPQDPWPKLWHHNTQLPPRRLCPGCVAWERTAYWLAQQGLADRAAAVAWARDLRADSTVALVSAVRDKTTELIGLYARLLDGTVLVDAVLRPTSGFARDSAGGVSALDLLLQLRDLGTRRLIGVAAPAMWHAASGTLWHTAGIPVDQWPKEISFRHSDWLDGHWSQWIAAPRNPGHPGLTISATSQHVGETGAPVERVDAYQAAIYQMAIGHHPTGPPACPLPAADTGLQLCSRPLATAAAGRWLACAEHPRP